MTRAVRIYTKQSLEPDSTVRLEVGPARHLVKVLRRRAGDAVILFNGDGRELYGRIIETRPPEACAIELESESRPAVESTLAVTLIQAIGRGERMDWAIQKACELGVTAIQPIFTERTEVRLSGSRAEKRLRHWRGVAIAACEQSGRCRIPDIRPAVALTDLEPDSDSATGYFLDPDGEERPSTLIPPEPAELAILIGPEGGLSEHELAWLRRHGFTGLRLGPRILRTETAGPAAIAMLQTRFGDWQ